MGKVYCQVRLTDDRKMNCKIYAAKQNTVLRNVLEKSLYAFLDRKNKEEVRYLPMYEGAKVVQIICDKELSDRVKEVATSDKVSFVSVFTTALLDYVNEKGDET